MTRTRLEVLQWYGLLGGALAWTALHVAGYGIGVITCSTSVSRWHIHASIWLIALTVVAGLAVLAAEAASLVVLRATADVDEDAPGPNGRLHFFAMAAALGNVLFLMIVVLDGASAVYHLPCRPS